MQILTDRDAKIGGGFTKTAVGFPKTSPDFSKTSPDFSKTSPSFPKTPPSFPKTSPDFRGAAVAFCSVYIEKDVSRNEKALLTVCREGFGLDISGSLLRCGGFDGEGDFDVVA